MRYCYFTMVRKISDDIIWIQYDQRSVNNYIPQLQQHLFAKFEAIETSKVEDVKNILSETFSWYSSVFEKLIESINDPNFLFYLFQYHEGSILLWRMSISGTDIHEVYNISEDELSTNRRVMKIALEKCCDIDYLNSGNLTAEKVTQINQIIEDLLFIGSELIGIGQYLAEVRMKPGTFSCTVEQQRFDVARLPEVEAIFSTIIDQDRKDCALGIFDEDGVNDLKNALQGSMQLDFDFVGYVITYIKRHHGGDNWKLQTIQPGIVVQNIVGQGVEEVNATSFYEGLVLGRHNKLSINDAVYRQTAVNRHLFKPILRVRINGEDRDLIGVNKWAESITAVTSNAIQWNKAPEEWTRNAQLKRYILDKSQAHDKLLEDQVEKVLQDVKLPYCRTITHFTPSFGPAVRVDIQSVGEMDFVWIDVTRRCIIVADCKYSRARYDMIAYSADYSIFTNEYERKIENKRIWIEANKTLVCEHFLRKYPGLKVNPAVLVVKSIFIINTPTFYMHIGKVITVCFFKLENLIKNNYTQPSLVVSEKTRTGSKIRIVDFPYFK